MRCLVVVSSACFCFFFPLFFSSLPHLPPPSSFISLPCVFRTIKSALLKPYPLSKLLSLYHPSFYPYLFKPVPQYSIKMSGDRQRDSSFFDSSCASYRQNPCRSQVRPQQDGVPGLDLLARVSRCFCLSFHTNTFCNVIFLLLFDISLSFGLQIQILTACLDSSPLS